MRLCNMEVLTPLPLGVGWGEGLTAKRIRNPSSFCFLHMEKKKGKKGWLAQDPHPNPLRKGEGDERSVN